MKHEKPNEVWLERSDGFQTPILGTCFIGRAKSSQVVLADDRVSRRHAMIHEQSPHGYWLIDLGSRNGTYLNGRRLTGPRKLEDQDLIEVCGARLVFRIAGALESAAASRDNTDKTIQDIKQVNCWLLVADVEDYTKALQRMPPEQVSQITALWLSECKQIVEDHGGTINKFLGDGFLAFWEEADGVMSGLVQALQVFKQRQLRAEPRFRVVLHYGRVLFGGGALSGEESLVGPEVNFVFRMEKLASRLRERTLASEVAGGRIQSLLPVESLGQQEVPSFGGGFTFFRF